MNLVDPQYKKSGVGTVPDVNPERNDILWLEGGVQASSDDPERNDILRLDEVKRQKSMRLINQ